MFNRLTFTDKLIDAHLGGDQSGHAEFVTRDADSYRQFVNKQRGAEIVAPYDHFWMKE